MAGNYFFYLDVSENNNNIKNYAGILTPDVYIDGFCKNVFGIGVDSLIVETLMVYFAIYVTYKFSRKIYA